MQIDFHFYAIAVLARWAGFNPDDSLVIAYASQYTDNATESEPIPLDTGKEITRFDPTRTAYADLEYLGREALSWSAQKRVYIPFHFIPPRQFDPEVDQTFDFVTTPNSQFIRWLLDQAKAEDNYKSLLCRVGIALHTFADTWAHQGFSGRDNRTENGISNIEVFNLSKRRYEPIHFLEQVLLNSAPEIGHAEAGYFPDLAYERWRFVYERKSKTPVARHNVEERMEAAQAIHEYFLDVGKVNPVTPMAWEELAPKLEAIFSQKPDGEMSSLSNISRSAYRAYHALSVEKRCAVWQDTFGDLFGGASALSYDKQEWRDQAFKGDTNWDGYSKNEWDQLMPMGIKGGFWDSWWVHFHRAALKQRHLVLENLP